MHSKESADLKIPLCQSGEFETGMTEAERMVVWIVQLGKVLFVVSGFNLPVYFYSESFGSLWQGGPNLLRMLTQVKDSLHDHGIRIFHFVLNGEWKSFEMGQVFC